MYWPPKGFRDRIYSGEILVVPPNRAAALLLRELTDLLARELGAGDLQESFGALSGDGFPEALDRGRSLIRSNALVRKQMWELISFIGECPKEYRIDSPRLRVQLPQRGGTPPRQLDIHRDVWFAAPRNQINLWMPLGNLTAPALAFWPDYVNLIELGARSVM